MEFQQILSSAEMKRSRVVRAWLQIFRSLVTTLKTESLWKRQPSLPYFLLIESCELWKFYGYDWVVQGVLFKASGLCSSQGRDSFSLVWSYCGPWCRLLSVGQVRLMVWLSTCSAVWLSHTPYTVVWLSLLIIVWLSPHTAGWLCLHTTNWLSLCITVWLSPLTVADCPHTPWSDCPHAPWSDCLHPLHKCCCCPSSLSAAAPHPCWDGEQTPCTRGIWS